ncbi:MAG: hypothetical protein ACPG51_18220, partial [Thiolinea sp.]
NHYKVAMAIQINPAFSDQWLGGVDMYEWGNGVAVYDEQRAESRLTVNAQFGEASVTNPQPGEQAESFVLHDGKLHQIISRSRIQNKPHKVFIAANHPAVSKAEAPLLQGLNTAAKTILQCMIRQNPNARVRNTERFGVDLEFKLMFDRVKQKKHLFIKQARPLQLR